MKQLRARADFETARIQAFLRDAGLVLRGDTRPLLSFDEVRRAARLEGQSYRGLKDVPIADIRGSVGRPNDFDASFLPVKPQMRKRWEQLDAAMRRGEAVPPIEVYHLGDVYFVKDGHHRVSVARHLGWKTIPARVIQVRTRAPLSGDMDAAALLQAKEYVDFLERTQLDRVRPCELPVMGDLAETIPAFQAQLSKASLPNWNPWRAVACGPERAKLDLTGLAQPTIRFLDELFRRLPEDSVVIADVGQHQMWAAQRYQSSSPRGFITSGGLGAMGFALPAAVGVQLAKPQTCVLCVSGDGGFQMNIQELATVHRLALPIKLVIVDNKYLGMVRQWQQLFYQRNYAETDLSDNPDFVEIAKAYKIHAWRLNEDALREYPVSDETGDLLERFLRSPEPELLVFDCHPEANVYPMVPAGAALSEMLFEEE